MNQLTISLECLRCKNLYDESKYLPRNLGPPCKHVVCDSCVKEILKKMSPSTFTFQCPIQGCYRQIRPESRYISKCFVEDALTLDSMRKPKTSKPSNPELPNEEIKSLQIKTDVVTNRSSSPSENQSKSQPEDKPERVPEGTPKFLPPDSRQSKSPEKIAKFEDSKEREVQNDKTSEAKVFSVKIDQPEGEIVKSLTNEKIDVATEESFQKQSTGQTPESTEVIQPKEDGAKSQPTKPDIDETDQKSEDDQKKQSVHQTSIQQTENDTKNHQNLEISENVTAVGKLVSKTFVESNDPSPVTNVNAAEQNLQKFVLGADTAEAVKPETEADLQNLTSKDSKDIGPSSKPKAEDTIADTNQHQEPNPKIEQLQAEISFQNEKNCALKDRDSKNLSNENQFQIMSQLVQEGEHEMRQRMTSDIGRVTRKYSTASQKLSTDENQEVLPESKFSPRTTEILKNFNLNASGSVDEVFSATLVQSCNKKVRKSIFDSQAQFNAKNIDHFPKTLDKHESNLRTITIENWLFSRKIVPHFFYNCVQFTRQSTSKGTSLHTVMNTEPILQETLFKITLLKYDSTEGSHFGFCDKSEALSLQENKMRFNPEQPHCYITDGYSKFKVSDTEFSALSWKTSSGSAFQSGDEIYIHVIPRKSVIFFLKRQNISVKYKGFEKFCDIRFFMTIVMRSNEFRFQKLI